MEYSFAVKRFMNNIYPSPACVKQAATLLQAVVWSFLGDNDVVHVTLAESGDGHAKEPGMFLQFGDRVATTIAHAGF